MKLFPDDMMNSSGGELSLDIIKNKLHFYELQSHEYHWQTFGLGEHMALSDLYTLMFNIKDEIVEKIMGYTGVRTKVMILEPLKNYAPGFPDQLASDIISFAKRLENFGSMNNMPDIENIAQGLSGSVSQIKYRLTLS